MMVASSWCELCRFDDPLMARAVATSIASMEFNVRMECAGAGRDGAGGGAAHVVEVCATDWHELAEVLDEIIDEQVEFDRAVAERFASSHRVRVIVVITLTGAADLLLFLGLLDW